MANVRFPCVYTTISNSECHTKYTVIGNAWSVYQLANTHASVSFLYLQVQLLSPELECCYHTKVIRARLITAQKRYNQKDVFASCNNTVYCNTIRIHM